MKQERRFIPSQEMRVLSSENGNRTISGYASVSNQLSSNLGGFREKISPGAFSECLNSDPDVRHLIDHDPAKILGRTKAGTLRLKEDDHGLHFECDLPDTTVAKDLTVSIARGDISQCSFGFYCEEDFWAEDKKTGDMIRTITKATVFDTSCVSYPAYEGTSVNLRSLFPEDKGNMPEMITNKIEEIRTAKRKEKRGRNILAAVSSSKWAILPEKLETICAFLNGWSDGHRASKEEIQAAMMGQDSSEYGAENIDNVAVLPIYGTIAPKATMMSEFSGGFSCESFTKDFRAALADDSVTAIVFDVDSPGGTVTGVPELAAEILAARGKKPIIASVSGMAASAGYWLASAADKLIVTPSGEVGSIGVYCTHQDVSGAMDKAGVKMQFIQAGKFKTEGNPYEPLSDSARVEMKKGVDEFYEMFVAGVAAGRGVSVEKVKADFGQGRMLMAKDALAAGMVDSIQTLDQVLAGLGADSSAPDSSIFTTDNSGLQAMNQNGCACLCNSCVNGDCAQCADPDCADDYCDDCGLMNDDAGMDDDEGLDTGDGAVVKPNPVKADQGNMNDCECNCVECKGNNCLQCTDENCNDKNCNCLDTSQNDDLGMKTDPKPVVADAEAAARAQKLKHLIMQIQ